jgi:hypothetical protein
MVEGLTYIEGPPSMNLFCSLSLFSCSRCIIPFASRPSRGGAVVARRAHNPKAGGSNPSPATKAE